MTPAQAIDFPVDSVGFERADADGEVRRSFDGSYGPLHRAAYMFGGSSSGPSTTRSSTPGK